MTVCFPVDLVFQLWTYDHDAQKEVTIFSGEIFVWLPKSAVYLLCLVVAFFTFYYRISNILAFG